ncbi:hypothetical protein FHR81_004367 [Actinoalloteichus hoggarensis]|uniref:hypothetical protein n=1 Tax=Actinoalloteichus hoggarensis TaxID=1470176 RepID=UPI0012FD896B|nr:hypothetical protein [Actinoalloteichus hoggarensis]MBB5923300.1 hypothetical protein [Actinoalloteichus hoggarensis]
MRTSRPSRAAALLPRWQEFTLLVRHAANRPRWQRVQAVIISLWSGAWILGQIGPAASRLSPLDVPGRALETVGVDIRDALRSAGEFLADPQRHTLLLICAWGAGLLWAATTERAQYTALAGWLLVMLAAEGLGYHEAVYRAVLGLVGFIVLLYLCSLPRRRVPVDRRARLLPRDVLSAGATASALAGIVPLLALGMLAMRVCGPYLTRPPTLVGEVPSPIRPESATPAVRADSPAHPSVERTGETVSDSPAPSPPPESPTPRLAVTRVPAVIPRQGGPAESLGRDGRSGTTSAVPDQPGAAHDEVDPVREID